jgi:hypothetical protein
MPMKAEDIVKFRNSILNYTLEELEAKRGELQNQLSKMIMDSDVVMQIAIVEAQIKEKGE